MSISRSFEIPPERKPWTENPEKGRFRFPEEKRLQMKESGKTEEEILAEEQIIANRINENLAA